MIPWSEIARSVGALDPSGQECGSDGMARQALELVLGPQALCEAVDYYVAQQPGSELVRHVLWLLHPWSAMGRCYEIYKNAEDVDERNTAVELLRVVADRRALPWIAEFLADADHGIQFWGVGVLDQLLWGGGIEEEECAALLDLARRHANPQVRKKAVFIDSFLQKRK